MGHDGATARQRDRYEPTESHLALWCVPAGHTPALAEGRDRLDLLRHDGPTAEAFTVARSFTPPPGG